MQPPCKLNVVQFTACLLAHLACVCLAKLWSTKRPRKFCSRAWFEMDWQNVVGSRTVRLCRYLASTRCGTFPQVYRGTERCCSTSIDFSERIVSTWSLLLIVGYLLEECFIVVDAVGQRGPSARRFPGVSWSVNGSGRVVLSHLISVAERGHAVRTVHRVTCHRTSSKSDLVDPRQKIEFRR